MDSGFLKGKKYIDLTSYFTNKGIEKEKINIGYNGRIIYNNEEYYLKDIREDINTLYCELIAVKLLDKLNLPHVNYYLVEYFGKAYLISKSFIEKKANYVSGFKVLDEYKDYLNSHLDIGDMNNLETIWNALEYRYTKMFNQNKAKKIVAKLMSELTTIYSFDIVVANGDRHQSNWIVKEAKDDISINTMFDNEYMLNSYLDDESLNSFALGIYPEDTEHFINYIDVIKKYIRDSSSEFINKLIMVYNTLSIDVFLQCIKEVEEEFQFIIPSENRQLIINSYKKHYELLGQILNDYQLHPSRLI